MKKTGYNHKQACKDHLGNKYNSLSEMCAQYNIKPETFQRRIKVYGWPLDKSLTEPVKANGGQFCYDHEGTQFKSESLMCIHWGINRKTFRYRINQGLSIEDALTQNTHPGKLLNKL